MSDWREYQAAHRKCPDCGLDHPGLIAWNLTTWSCPDPVFCIRALSKKMHESEAPPKEQT